MSQHSLGSTVPPPITEVDHKLEEDPALEAVLSRKGDSGILSL